jgi:hypothetical protein
VSFSEASETKNRLAGFSAARKDRSKGTRVALPEYNTACQDSLEMVHTNNVLFSAKTLVPNKD